MLLKNKWLNEEIKKEIRKYLKTNENANTTLQNLWNAAKLVLRGKFIPSLYKPSSRNKKRLKNNLTYLLK